MLPQPDGTVYVGLTDEPVSGEIPDVPEPSEPEIGFLLDVVSAAFARQLHRSDVIGAFAGLRPLLHSADGSTADLSRKHKVMAPGIIEWGTTPKDFFERKAAMIWTTTGNLTNIRANAKFPFGVGMLPKNKRGGSPTGGGNFYLSKKASPAQQEAAVRFARWMTQPERAAQWSIDTGYVAVAPAAYDTPAMKAYVASFPQSAVARDQLPVAEAELSTHENQRVTKALNDNLQAALSGDKTPERAMKDAQAEAERILKPYR